MRIGISNSISSFNYVAIETASLDQDIARLFENGEEGAWYDPSDLTTLYQDSSGTTPVTAAGQPVGLMLDKSKGLALGSELWTGSAVTVEAGWVDNGGGSYTATSTTNRFYSQVGIANGKAYTVSFTVSEYVSGNVSVGSGSTLKTAYITGNGSYSVTFRQSSTTAGNLLFDGVLPSFTGTISNISVRELPGNHAVQSTSTARPTLQLSGSSYYLDFDGVDDRMVATFAATVNRPADIAIAWNRDVTANGYIYNGATADGRLFLQTYNNPPRAIQIGNYDPTAGGVAGNWEDSATSGVVDAVVTARFTPTSPYRDLRINGSAASVIFNSGASGGNSWDGVTLGSSYNSSVYSNINIYGYVGVNRTLDPDEINTVENYLADKTGAFVAPVITGVPTISVS